MFKTIIALSAFVYVVGISTITMAADQQREQQQDRIQKQDQIYGGQLMTPDEWTEHRNKMHSLNTNQEREAYRFEHHKRMQERAKEKGLTLSDSPRAPGSGMGLGGGRMGREGSGRRP